MAKNVTDVPVALFLFLVFVLEFKVKSLFSFFPLPYFPIVNFETSTRSRSENNARVT